MRKAAAAIGLAGAMTFLPVATSHAQDTSSAPRQEETTDDDDDGDKTGLWGLLGLLGLAGLAGLKRRERVAYTTGPTTTDRPGTTRP